MPAVRLGQLPRCLGSPSPLGKEASEGVAQPQLQEALGEPAVGRVLSGGEHDPALLFDEGLDKGPGVVIGVGEDRNGDHR